MITCGIIAALRKRGLKVSSFKCGPDYIDPMFHSRILGAKSRNLDTFFTDRDITRYLMKEGAEGTDISVVEGVMGYYDGLGGIDTQASAYDLADATNTPAVLIVDTKGMSVSVLAEIKGFLTYRENSHIAGVILNRMSPMLYAEVKGMVERELGVRVFGYVPKITEFTLESRHLGLVLPDEVKELEEKFDRLAEMLEKSLDVDGLIELAARAGELCVPAKAVDEGNIPDARCGKHDEIPEKLWKILSSKAADAIRTAAPRIAVARDEAFCFIYEDNLALLEKLGGKLVFFSPLHDERLPEDIDGMLLYGGYPELYADKLSANRSMRLQIREKLKAGFPCLAECGGFMYLHSSMEDMEGNAFEMVGAIDGRAYRTEKLGRFGYIELTRKPAKEDQISAHGQKEEAIASKILGKESAIVPKTSDEGPVIVPKTPLPQALGDGIGVIRAHEFHYFDSTSCGDAFHAKKPLRKRSWDCIHASESQILGFPHLYYYGNPALALQFLEACVRGREE